MKKIIKLSAVLSFLAFNSFGQNNFPPTGNAGIGSTNVLEFGAGISAKEINAGKIGYATFDNVGTGALCIVGAGTTSTNRRIHFWNEGGAVFEGLVTTNAALDVNTNAEIGKGGDKYSTALTLIKNGDGNGVDNPVLTIKHSGNGSNNFGNSGTDLGVIRIQGFNPAARNKAINSMDNFIVYTNGQVQIGNTQPTGIVDYKLAVSGKVYCQEVNVTPSTAWSDYVFKNDYNLATLEEVETHIKEKGHLKDVPSAEEVGKNGIKLGEMDATLLRKIEELTLYTIELNKSLSELKKENQAIKQTLQTINK